MVLINTDTMTSMEINVELAVQRMTTAHMVNLMVHQCMKQLGMINLFSPNSFIFIALIMELVPLILNLDLEQVPLSW